MNQVRPPDPLYAGSRSGGANAHDGRNGVASRTTPSTDSGSMQGRAEKFDDEKRRIIESCFSKREEDGSLFESYITHVRVIEDSMYPSSPPPPDSISSNKKQRIIMVAVRKSGRVRVHKGRENPNGTFSIGKTWPLDDLTAIQNFVGLVPANSQEQQSKVWAGSMGFVVILGKPYYWQAATSKEKDFFIASLVKIFRKYTGGRLPELVGFDPQQFQQFTGLPSSRVVSASQTPSLSFSTATPTVTPQVPPDRSRAEAESRASSRAIPGPSPLVEAPADSNGYHAWTQDSQRTPVRDDLRSLAPVEVTPPRRDHAPPDNRGIPRYQTTPDHSGSRRPSHDGSIQPTSGSRPSTARPSLSARSSHSSLQPDTPISKGPTIMTSSLQPPPIPTEAELRSLGATPSETSLRTFDTANSALSRPSTAASEKKVPTGHREPPRPVVEMEPEPVQRKTPTPRPEPVLDRRSIHSEVTAPLGTFTAEPTLSASRENEVNSQTPVPPQVDGSAVLQESVTPQEAAVANAVTAPSAPGMTSEPETLTMEKKLEEEHRPGLGPMVKKKSAKDIASTFRKAAFAASAFQPRQGGAAARFRAQQEKQGDGPDGITGVVPAPLLRGMSSDSAKSGTLTPMSERDRPLTPAIPLTPKVQIQRTATDDSLKIPQQLSVVKRQVELPPDAPSPEKTRDRSPERRKRQRQEADIERYCSSLGLDPRIVDGRGAEFNDLLTEFGWQGRLADGQRLDVLEADIRREIGRAQATGWLGHIEQQDDKIQELAKAFEKAIEECEELDGLLTLYSHELDTLNDDIQYIEAQSQGLQVQTANQKLLQKELQDLLATLRIPSRDLQGIYSGSLDTADGLQMVENSLAVLYQAMLTIDPDIRQNKLRHGDASSGNRAGTGATAEAEIRKMHAVEERKHQYREQTASFLRRLTDHMTRTFKNAEHRTSEERSRSSVSLASSSLNTQTQAASRQELWMYNALLLFAREVNTYEWQTLIRCYEMTMKGSYQDQFRDYVNGRKKAVRSATGDEQDILFTAQEKDEKHDTSLASTATRKLTMKRTKTPKASNLRPHISERTDGQLHPFEMFAAVVQELAKAIAEEQNFIVHFFHLNSHYTADFTELISRPPHQRRLPNLTAKQSYDPDRDMSRTIQQTVEGIYTFWPGDLQQLLDWCLAFDPMQGVGILCAIEQSLGTYEETNQEYISRTLRALHDRLTISFHKFIDEQVKAVEETKVKIKKRKGIISFMRVFPQFSNAVEAMIPPSDHESLEIRFIINDAYTKILKAMWESLTFIAKDDSTTSNAGVQSHAPASGDPEDKEALNYHILLIENMNHYIEELDTGTHNVVLEEWAERARHDLFTHLTQYTDSVIRRPLGKWLDFLESTEALMKTVATGTDYTSVASKPSHSRSAAKKVLSTYDSKEVRKGAETLRKRVEKHFGDIDEQGLHVGSRTLVGRVLEECQSRYVHSWDRMRAVIDKVYEGGGLEIEWKKDDLGAVFRK